MLSTGDAVGTGQAGCHAGRSKSPAGDAAPPRSRAGDAGTN